MSLTLLGAQELARDEAIVTVLLHPYGRRHTGRAFEACSSRGTRQAAARSRDFGILVKVPCYRTYAAHSAMSSGRKGLRRSLIPGAARGARSGAFHVAQQAGVPLLLALTNLVE